MQLSLTRAAAVDLTSYNCILVSSSGGKDSQAMLDEVCRRARDAGVLDRVVVVHADLGRMEWPGTKTLAEEQADHYGVRFEVVSRLGQLKTDNRGGLYEKGERFGDLLDYARRRGKWPDAGNRWCTSDFKRAPIKKLITRLHREAGGGAWRLLNCMGMRAEESPRRASMVAFEERCPLRSTRDRQVDNWLPIHHWTEDEVWTRIRTSGVRYHPAYDLGMPRLSCSLCIFAPRAALIIAGRARPDLLEEYVAVERETGHTFRNGFSLQSIQDAIAAGEDADPAELRMRWAM